MSGGAGGFFVGRNNLEIRRGKFHVAGKSGRIGPVLVRFWSVFGSIGRAQGAGRRAQGRHQGAGSAPGRRAQARRRGVERDKIDGETRERERERDKIDKESGESSEQSQSITPARLPRLVVRFRALPSPRGAAVEREEDQGLDGKEERETGAGEEPFTCARWR